MEVKKKNLYRVSDPGKEKTQLSLLHMVAPKSSTGRENP
jgi:hypothetical protein